jgi:hypothetical protein
LKRIGFRQRYPDTSRASDFRKLDPIDKLKFVGAFDDTGLGGGMNRKRAG